jgi:hypothetical protein
MKNNRSGDYIFERLNAAGEKLVRGAKKETLEKDLETGYDLRKFTLPNGRIYTEFILCVTRDSRDETWHVFTALKDENGKVVLDSLWEQCRND